MRKMTRQEFMDLSSDQQLDWIEKNIEEYEVLLYSDGYLGCSYPTEEINLADYENYPLDYDTSGMIKTQSADITQSRMEEIDEGAPLFTKDRQV